ncbi:MAG: tetratricopeptide repeat protein [Endomicrobiales bacterium]|nr:tetratricopeptide repeat protein [Endomicrobiales bacterium]
MSQISRRELKKNELEDLVIKTAEWIKNNRQLFTVAAASVIFLILFGVFFFYRFHVARARANDKLAFAESHIFSGQIDRGLGLLDEIISQYSGTSAAAQARLLKADYFVDSRKYEDAASILSPIIASGKPKRLVPFAVSFMGLINENRGKYDEAVSAYLEFLDKYPEHFLTPKIYESLGRVYEIKGSVEDAKTTYEKLTALYPVTGWAKRAQERLAALAQQSNR